MITAEQLPLYEAVASAVGADNAPQGSPSFLLAQKLVRFVSPQAHMGHYEEFKEAAAAYPSEYSHHCIGTISAIFAASHWPHDRVHMIRELLDLCFDRGLAHPWGALCLHGVRALDQHMTRAPVLLAFGHGRVPAMCAFIERGALDGIDWIGYLNTSLAAEAPATSSNEEALLSFCEHFGSNQVRASMPLIAEAVMRRRVQNKVRELGADVASGAGRASVEATPTPRRSRRPGL